MSASAPGSPFETYLPEDVAQLIAEFPLAWVCPRASGAEPPALLPLLADVDTAGQVTALVGHMSRRNPLMAALQASPEAVILFTGPQAYVSPARVSEANWAPTWNYAQVRIEARLRFEPEVSGALGRLVAAMETAEPTGWTSERLGARYAPMEAAIIGFRAEALAVHARFKLGQDERVAALREILERHPDPALVRWMRRMNAARLSA
ncbi:FMN-binding negative transcriptional regulator [Phenylobacterium sp. LjRoot225]|uniref:FMN-binding negative transcriptional regulator n=1 Tax=Phenylobacterium sp. LjRoot225 TaxID=3342285 RepID=UPI003ED07D39